MDKPVYILPTRLSEPTHYAHQEFSKPIWTEFREDPDRWVRLVTTTRNSWRSGDTFLTKSRVQ